MRATVRARARARDIIDCSLRPHTQHQSIQDRQRHSADCGAAHTSHINTRVRSNAHSLFTRTRTTRTDAAESFDVSHSAQPRDSLQRHALPRDLSSAPRPRSHSNGRHVRLPPVKATRVTPASLHTHTRRVRTSTCWRPPPAHVPHPAPCTLHRPSPASAHLRIGSKETRPLASRGGPGRQCRRGIGPAPCPP